ncbi:hypothetical protein OH77DRAFT_1424680 [Trametes cingulata]|nr:hypothetical protein OH77DRAFT_1424680 [Trametes cingulata]
MDNSSASHSPTFVKVYTTLTSSEVSYPGRYGGVADDQRIPLTPLSTSSYMFPPSRSLSPAMSMPSSTSSASLVPASYPFTFPEGAALQDRPGFYRRPHAPELTLHGSTADISSIVLMSACGGPVSWPRHLRLRLPFRRGGPHGFRAGALAVRARTTARTSARATASPPRTRTRRARAATRAPCPNTLGAVRARTTARTSARATASRPRTRTCRARAATCAPCPSPL